MTWVTASEKAKKEKAQNIKAQLSALDEKLQRCFEIIVKASPDALAEVIDSAGTTRGDILNKKEMLREQLKSISTF